jgi:hypothetical protein
MNAYKTGMIALAAAGVIGIRPELAMGQDIDYRGITPDAMPLIRYITGFGKRIDFPDTVKVNGVDTVFTGRFYSCKVPFIDRDGKRKSARANMTVMSEGENPMGHISLLLVKPKTHDFPEFEREKSTSDTTNAVNAHDAMEFADRWLWSQLDTILIFEEKPRRERYTASDGDSSRIDGIPEAFGEKTGMGMFMIDYSGKFNQKDFRWDIVRDDYKALIKSVPNRQQNKNFPARRRAR